MSEKGKFLISLPARLDLFIRELNWISEILSDALALSETKGKEAWSSYAEVTKNIAGEDLYQAEDAHRTLVNYIFHFDYISLHSLFVTANSVVENFILDLGSNVEEMSESKIKIADINSRGGEVDRVRKYLDLVHNFKFASSEDILWNELIKFQQIRHLITHNRNKLKNKKSNNEHLKPFLEKFDAHFTRSGEFQIRNKEFMTSFKATALSYVTNLASDCFKQFNEKRSEVKS
jgi:hypothetical protein